MFFKNSKESKKILVIDIGTSSINGFYIEIISGKKPRILKTLHRDLEFLNDPNFQTMWGNIKSGILEIFTFFKKNDAKFHVDFAEVILSSPWYLSQTRMVRVKRDYIFTVNEGLVDDLIEEETAAFLKKSVSHLKMEVRELAVLEKYVMKVFLNGYPAPQPFGKKAQELVLCLYVSICRNEIARELGDLVRHQFPRTRLIINSSPAALFQIFRRKFDPEEGFIIADIGGEITEITFVSGQVIEEVATFPRGGNFIVRRLASGLGIPVNDALTLLKSRTKGALKEELSEKIKGLIEGASKEWYKFFYETISDIGNEKPLPQSLILIGGAAGIDILKLSSQSEDLSKFTILGRSFTTQTYLPENFESELDYAGIDRKDPQMSLPLLLVLSSLENAKK
ncbi:hypothetical protein HYW53_02445 [Candidatus Giovannonibacteria bacterium]|nr:hypothetical protein [Candidatus Giovannonibacteria bacterium]